MRRIALALLLLACSDVEATVRTLHAAGYSDVVIGRDYPWFACSKDDDYATAFTAKNPAGGAVSGVVCCGIIKSCTIRF